MEGLLQKKFMTYTSVKPMIFSGRFHGETGAIFGVV